MQQTGRDSPPRLICQSGYQTEGTRLLFAALQAFHQFQRLGDHRQRQTLKKAQNNQLNFFFLLFFYRQPVSRLAWVVKEGHEIQADSFRYYPEKKLVHLEIIRRDDGFQNQGGQSSWQWEVSPSVGGHSPQRMFISVVFPVPLCPSSAVIWPS